jgi:hypothetical protein
VPQTGRASGDESSDIQSSIARRYADSTFRKPTNGESSSSTGTTSSTRSLRPSAVQIVSPSSIRHRVMGFAALGAVELEKAITVDHSDLLIVGPDEPSQV